MLNTGALRNGVHPRLLPFGEVKVGHEEVAIGCESLPHVSPCRRGLYQRAAAAAGIDPEVVLVVCITEAGIEVDAIDFDDVRLLVRTMHVRLSHCAGVVPPCRSGVLRKLVAAAEPRDARRGPAGRRRSAWNHLNRGDHI